MRNLPERLLDLSLTCVFVSGPGLVMTQQEFKESLEAALSWMRVVQERLKANDNTQGPRDALEGRLRETEVRYFTFCWTLW